MRMPAESPGDGDHQPDIGHEFQRVQGTQPKFVTKATPGPAGEASAASGYELR